MRVRQIFMLLTVCSAVFLQGCLVAAVGAGAGTVAYIKGDLEAVESAKLDDVYEASLEAMDELELPVTKKTKDALSAVIYGRDAEDKKIKINLETTADEMTKISIRIGTFGNESKSNLIYKKIQENL